ncbi:MAG: GatB/YqeY domain-containing protein [bacterium]
MIQQIKSDLKIALIEKDKIAANTLRSIMSMYTNEEKNNKDKNIDVESIIKKEIKKRKEAIILYESNKRDDLKKIELAEMEVLSKYLPEQISDQELKKCLMDLKNEISSNKEFNIGFFIRESIKAYSSKSDNGTISKLCKEIMEV